MERPLFRDRSDAGRTLAAELSAFRGAQSVVLAIPRGGVPVGFEIAKSLNAPLDVVVSRKIPIPGNTEAGFGAVTADGTIVLNQPLVDRLGLTREVIARSASEVQQEIIRRTLLYRGSRALPDLQGKTAILVDDGLASGYTMIAAVESVRKSGPAEVVVAVPVCPESAAELVRPVVDRFYSILVARTWTFAVASYYDNWYDLSDGEVLDYLRRARESTRGPSSG